jgi:hypothetical protein
MSAIAKPLMGLSSMWYGVHGARILDRLCAGARSAPRDAIVASSLGTRDRGGGKTSDRRDERPPKTSHEIPDKGVGYNYGAWADHADRHGNEKLTLVKPAELVHQSLLQERHNDQTAAEGQRARFQETTGAWSTLTPRAGLPAR